MKMFIKSSSDSGIDYLSNTEVVDLIEKHNLVDRAYDELLDFVDDWPKDFLHDRMFDLIIDYLEDDYDVEISRPIDSDLVRKIEYLMY